MVTKIEVWFIAGIVCDQRSSNESLLQLVLGAFKSQPGDSSALFPVPYIVQTLVGTLIHSSVCVYMFVSLYWVCISGYVCV